MTVRTLRAMALTVAAGAMVVVTAAPALAAQSVTSLPGKITVSKGEVFTVTIDTPVDFTCAAAAAPGQVGWTTRVVGQRAAIASVSAVDCSVAGKSTWTITAASLDAKKNAVVKFIAVRSTDPSLDNARTVGTLVVKLNPTAKPGTGKPAGAGKPAS